MLIKTEEEIIGTTDVDTMTGGVMLQVLDAADLGKADLQIFA